MHNSVLRAKLRNPAHIPCGDYLSVPYSKNIVYGIRVYRPVNQSDRV